MENRRRNKPFCGDTFNSLSRQNKNFQWSASYKWFLNKIPEEKKNDKLCTIGIINTGCVPNFFYFKESISWCALRFDSRTRIIKVTTKEKNPVILTPKLFKKMFHLPSANKPLKLVHEDTFLASQEDDSNILREFLLPSTNMSTAPFNN
jgi:hypothetical protein